MSEQTRRLKITLGDTDNALNKLLKAELYKVFCEYMDVDDIDIDVAQDCITVKATGGGIKKVGYGFFDKN